MTANNAMSEDAPFTPPRKKPSVFWWLGGVCLLLLLLFLIQLFGPNPRMVVSRQTTYITEPLGANGLPDYEQFLLELSREGVTPENNAAVLLWQALFPGGLEREHHSAVAAELGLDQIPSEEDALEPLHSTRNRVALASMLVERAALSAPHAESAPIAVEHNLTPDVNDANSDTVEQLLDQAMTRPWTSDQFPPLARWVAENRSALELIVEASRRPRYHMPPPSLLNNRRDLLIQMELHHVQSMREAGRSLPARAMWHLGEGRREEAWQDLLALHRIARLVAQGHTLVEQLVALGLSATACDATATLLHHAELSKEQARQIHQDLAALPLFAVVARTLDEAERAWALDATISVGSGGGGELFSALGGGQDVGNNAFDVVSVDWNLVLRDANRWYDRLAAAARLPDHRARAAALATLDADIQMLQAESRATGHLVAGVISRQQRSKLVSAMILGIFLPAVGAATNVEDRENTNLELMRLAAALAVHRARHGAYPEKLRDLVPSVFEELPVDLYNATPFAYQRTADGFLLYSLGENGVDDGGSNERLRVLNGQSLYELSTAEAEKLEESIPTGSDDLSIRVPQRRSQWPPVVPSTEEP